jgi:hypothetical protein
VPLTQRDYSKQHNTTADGLLNHRATVPLLQFDSARNLSGKQEKLVNVPQHSHSAAGGRSLKSAMRKPKTLLNLNRISISNSIVSDKPEAIRNRRAELMNLIKTIQKLTACDGPGSQFSKRRCKTATQGRRDRGRS